MLVSLNWIRDYVDLPDDLDPRDLGERFTRTTAEVDGVRAIHVGARGLCAARVVSMTPLTGTKGLHLVTLDAGGSESVETVTAAPDLHQGANVVYAPPGSFVAALGAVGIGKVAGRTSRGMILPGDALGIPMAAEEAVFLSNETKPGDPLPAELFEDWVIEIDNKSITHRPDLWGHYGVAREIAAIYGLPLKPYPVATLDEISSEALPEIEISIADPNACRRYSGLLFEGVPTQPAPLWMQLRLGHIGMRPITGLVDLTNYIMADLGQPMHAFDAATVDRIEVDWAKEGERFITLDGVQRTLTAGDLMIQCRGRSVALAGVMGGLETEVSETTTSLLLESANFNPATIRRTAARLGLRTDASTRFEKSLDPAHTVLGIQRFVALARTMYPNMRLTSRLSDAYPKPAQPVQVSVNPRHVARTIGRDVPFAEVTAILEPLGFMVRSDGDVYCVEVPSFRATNDVSIEDDVIEEIARYIGYNNIPPEMPRVSVRNFTPNALHELERRALEYFTTAFDFHEIQGYLWYDAGFLARLGVDPGPCVTLSNPPAEGLDHLRRSLIPGMLASVVKNRFHFPAISLVELGSVFEAGHPQDRELRHVGLVRARRGKGMEHKLYADLKGAVEGWAWLCFARKVRFTRTEPDPKTPWEHPRRTALINIDGTAVGHISVIDLSLRRKMDEHLASWSIVWATLCLNDLEHLGRDVEPLDGVPQHPLVEMDFSIVVPKTTPYQQVIVNLASFVHPLLKRVRFVSGYEGEAVPPGKRSLTFRAVIGHDARTLVDEDATAFRTAFRKHVLTCGYELRA